MRVTYFCQQVLMWKLNSNQDFALTMVAGGFGHNHCQLGGGGPTKRTYTICTPWATLSMLSLLSSIPLSP
jgi:hypothetical protein